MSAPEQTVSGSQRWLAKLKQAHERNRADAVQAALSANRRKAEYCSVGAMMAGYEAAASEHARRHAGRPRPETVNTNLQRLRRISKLISGTSDPYSVSTALLTAEAADKALEVMVKDIVSRKEKAGDQDIEAAQRRARISANSTLRMARSCWCKWALQWFTRHGVAVAPGLAEWPAYTSAIPPYEEPPQHLIDSTHEGAADLKREKSPRYIVYVLCYQFGMRVGDAARARWEWLKKRDDRYAMEWRAKKNGRFVSIPCPESTYQTLRELPTGEKYILPGAHPTDRSSLCSREFAAWMNRIGWSEYSKCAHELRKLAGSQWFIRGGAEVAAKYLGDNLQTVLRFYACVPRRQAPEIDLLD